MRDINKTLAEGREVEREIDAVIAEWETRHPKQPRLSPVRIAVFACWLLLIGGGAFHLLAPSPTPTPVHIVRTIDECRPDQCLDYDKNADGYFCVACGGSGGSGAVSSITSGTVGTGTVLTNKTLTDSAIMGDADGTNPSARMVIGTGASLATTGTSSNQKVEVSGNIIYGNTTYDNGHHGIILDDHAFSSITGGTNTRASNVIHMTDCGIVWNTKP